MQTMPDRFCGGLNCEEIVRWTKSGWRHAKQTKATNDHPPLPGELVMDG